MLWLHVTCAVGVIGLLAAGALGRPTEAPRADGRVLHADFEHFTDGVYAPLDAGVMTVGQQEILIPGGGDGKAEVTRDFGLSGSRCLRLTRSAEAKGVRIRLQRRWDAPAGGGETVAEFAFRAAVSEAVDLEDWLLWRGEERESGAGVGIELRARGSAAGGTYDVEVRCGDSAPRPAAAGLPQAGWVRFIMHRRPEQGTVDLWIGAPGEEVRIGAYRDLRADLPLDAVVVGAGGAACGAGCWDDVRIGRPLAAGAEVAPPEPALCDAGAEAPGRPAVISVGGEHQLFVDDWLIEDLDGVTRTLHPVRKHPKNPLLVADRPWEGPAALLYGGVHREPGGLFRMWYLAWNSAYAREHDRPEEKSFICYAESEDGLTWRKPSLGLYDYRGSKDHNIVVGYGMSNTSAFYDPRDAETPYKIVTRQGGHRLYVSRDGLHFEDRGLTLLQGYDSTSFRWDPQREVWMASVKIIRDGKRARGYAESPDLVHWSDTCLMATVDERDLPQDQIYAMIVFPYHGLYLGLLRMYHVGDPDTVDVQLAVSRNGKRWERPIREPFIPTAAEQGAWDWGNNAPAGNAPLRVGDELWFYYSGRSVRHDAEVSDGAIGLGVLRVDGFVSVDAGDAEGALTTRRLRLGAGRLCVNADVAGSLVVEVLGGDGVQMTSEPVTGDSLRHAVRWRGGADPAAVAGEPVRLRFRLRRARLYSFFVE